MNGMSIYPSKQALIYSYRRLASHMHNVLKFFHYLTKNSLYFHIPLALKFKVNH